jgi:hypothetical protein
MTRKSELLRSKWPEFDLDVAKWDIPAERMKMSSPPDGLGGWPLKSRQPDRSSVGARRAASRVRWRRASPALDPARRAKAEGVVAAAYAKRQRRDA